MTAHIFLSLFLLLAFTSYSMEKDQKEKNGAVDTQRNTIDWDRCKQAYLKWYQNQSLATEQRWQLLKEAIESKEILFNDHLFEKEYPGFFAYVGPFECDGQQVIYMYPSPQWMESKIFLGFLRSNVDKAYTVGTVQEPDLPFLGWQHLEQFPKELNQPKESTFPDWQNKKLFTLYSFDFKNPPQEFQKQVTVVPVTVDNVTSKELMSTFQLSSYCTIN